MSMAPATNLPFDPAALVDALYDEISTFAAASTFWTGQEEEKLSPKEKLDRFLKEAPLPDRDLLAAVMGETFWSSTLAEEGRPCRPRIAFSAGDPPPTHRFAQPRPITRESLRKLSLALAPRDCFVWERIDGEPKMTGIEIRPRPWIPRHLGPTISVTAPGALDLSWNMVRLVTCRGGEILRASTCGFGDLHAVAQFFISKFAAPSLSVAFIVIEAILEQGHGGSLWILGDPALATHEGLEIGTPVDSDDQGIFERFPKAAEDAKYGPWLRSVAKLGAVDGAILVDTKFRVLGFGTFIKDLKVDLPLAERMKGGKVKLTESPDNKRWGGRHRSAVAFCARFAPAAAFVVSEDGGITAFLGEKDAHVWCEPIVRLGNDI
jgi:hypothetical protein